jgi:hypothetical protein
MATFHQFEFNPVTGAVQPAVGDAHQPFTGGPAAQWDPDSPTSDPHTFPSFSADLAGVDTDFAPNIIADGSGPLHRSLDDDGDDCDTDDPDVDDDVDCDPDDPDADDDCDRSVRGLHFMRSAAPPSYYLGRPVAGGQSLAGQPGPFSRSRQ